MKILIRIIPLLIILQLIAVTTATTQNALLPPTVQDCLGAIPVCQPVYTTTNSYTGHGNVYPEIHDDSNCPLCMDGEKNDVFYVITVQTSGILRFSLTPNNPTNDYDWAMFNMTNADCDQIYTNATALQVSCNSYGVLGTNGPTGINSLLGNLSNCNGPGNLNGPPFNKDLVVLAGQTYILNISNWSPSNQSGYTLDFSASTAAIFDNVPPVVDSIQETIPCEGSSELFVRFSENVKCSDAYQHPEKFTLTSPSGSYTITEVGSPGCITGATQSPSYVLEVTPPLSAGSYTLNIVGDIHDLCDNLALYQGYPFELTEINAPAAGAGNDTTVNNGAVITLHGSGTGGQSPLSYHWEPASLLVNPDVPQPTTINMGASTVFTVTVTDNVGCDDSDDMTVTVIGGPLGVATQATPSTVCKGSSSQLAALASGGSGNYTYSWTSNPAGFTSNLPNPTVMPMQTTSYTVNVFDGFLNATSATTVYVNQVPIVNAGNDASIPFGTNVTLHGTAAGGTPTVEFYWTSNPPGYTSNISDPTFINLQQTTAFILVVTDLGTGCVSQPDEVIVTVTGSPLACNPVAFPSIICKGISTQLMAMVGGGSGTYNYQWSSVPAGFSSTEQNPVVTPQQTTSYLLSVNDNFNTASGSVTVQVNPAPVVNLGPPDTMVCIYNTVTLDAGNSGSSYLWSNGATTQSILVETTGITYDVQNYWVKVINNYACMDSAAIQLIFAFAACTAIDEAGEADRIRVYPNPTDGALTLSLDETSGPIRVTLLSVPGKVVFSETTNASGPVFEKTYDLSFLARGLYFLRVEAGRLSKVVKFLKQ